MNERRFEEYVANRQGMVHGAYAEFLQHWPNTEKAREYAHAIMSGYDFERKPCNPRDFVKGDPWASHPRPHSRKGHVDTNELRLGNVVKSYDHEKKEVVCCRIKAIYDGGSVLADFGGYDQEVFAESLMPIALDDRILGVLSTWKYAEPCNDWGIDDLEINKYDGRYDIESDGLTYIADVASLHRLQNIYFAVEGEELDLSPLGL